MPRKARVKYPEAIYHLMARSITEFDMFCDDEDKDYFLDLLKMCKEKYCCKVYAYCLMTNHYHIMLDTNGFDISKFMKSLNQRYVKYINKKYGRRGHLLAERFYSKVVHSTEYVLTASIYIHSNAKDIPMYSQNPFEYKYSSMPIYMNKKKDTRNIIDVDFILGCINQNDKRKASKAYIDMVTRRFCDSDNLTLEKYIQNFEVDQFEYRPYRTVLLRNKSPEDVVNLLAGKFGIKEPKEIMHRWKRSSLKLREAVAYALTTFCGMGTKEICEYMKNISGACLSRLSSKGFLHFSGNSELYDLLTK